MVPTTYRVPHCCSVVCRPSLENPANIHNPHKLYIARNYIPKLRFRPYDVGLSGFVLMQLLSKVNVSAARRTGVKTEFNLK